MIDKTLQFLAQLRPSSTAAVSLYSPEAAANRQPGEQVIVKRIFVTNLSNQDREFSIYFDNDGTTYDETTAIVFEAIVERKTTEMVDIELPMRNSSGNLAVQTDSANDLNFTLTGLK